jgi:DNA-directed RNA polymerase specialized sigma24 family protein
MSPLVVRRYRADRLLREEFDRLRKRVVGGVSGRLLAAGVRFDPSDLEACYSQAWQGLYAAVLDGEEIGNPAAWLTLVTYRRAIDEHRSRRTIALTSVAGSHAPADRAGPAALAPEDPPADRRDIAADLDDRARLRQLFEALRSRLSAREQQAATLVLPAWPLAGRAAADNPRRRVV